MNFLLFIHVKYYYISSHIKFHSVASSSITLPTLEWGLEASIFINFSSQLSNRVLLQYSSQKCLIRYNNLCSFIPAFNSTFSGSL